MARLATVNTAMTARPRRTSERRRLTAGNSDGKAPLWRSWRRRHQTPSGMSTRPSTKKPGRMRKRRIPSYGCAGRSRMISAIQNAIMVRAALVVSAAPVRVSPFCPRWTRGRIQPRRRAPTATAARRLLRLLLEPADQSGQILVAARERLDVLLALLVRRLFLEELPEPGGVLLGGEPGQVGRLDLAGGRDPGGADRVAHVAFLAEEDFLAVGCGVRRRSERDERRHHHGAADRPPGDEIGHLGPPIVTHHATRTSRDDYPKTARRRHLRCAGPADAGGGDALRQRGRPRGEGAADHGRRRPDPQVEAGSPGDGLVHHLLRPRREHARPVAAGGETAYGRRS